MRLGAPVFGDRSDPDKWVAAVRASGYGAAYCPVGLDAPDDEIAAFAKAAGDADIVIAEVGAWSNPVSPVDEVRAASIERCRKALTLAEKIGARTAVTVTGSRGSQDPSSVTSKGWAGHHPDNLTGETFDLIVETIREIIDAVKPERAAFGLEMMPWMYPDSADSNLRLIEAIDRKALGVHLDPVNIICSPQRFFNNGRVIRECFEKLGPHVRSCHAKDVKLHEGFLVHLDECRPGTGSLDYRTFLTEASRLHADLPIMLEHLPNEEEYKLAAEYVRSVARATGLEFVS